MAKIEEKCRRSVSQDAKWEKGGKKAGAQREFSTKKERGFWPRQGIVLPVPLLEALLY
jgi:hypothetical protein